MQISMNMTSENKKIFVADLQRYMGSARWNVSKLAKNTGIHQSQVSRIVAVIQDVEFPMSSKFAWNLT